MVIAGAIAALAPTPALATGDWWALRATDSSASEWDPHVDDGILAWREDPAGGTIRYGDLLTAANGSVTRGDIAEGYRLVDGRLAWTSTVAGAPQVFVHDILTGVTRQVTDGPESNRFPNLSGSQLVWLTGSGGAAEIMLEDLRTGTVRRLTDNLIPESPPIIDCGLVVWTVGTGADSEVFLHDTYAGVTRQITTNTRQDANPQISSGHVVWTGGVGTDSDIYDYDVVTRVVRTLSAPGVEDLAAGTEAGWATWVSRDGLGTYHVMGMALSGGDTTELSSGPLPKMDLRADLNAATWVEGLGDAAEVVVREPTTPVNRRITTNTISDTDAMADGGLVTWTGGPAFGEQDIYLGTKDEPFPDVPPHHPNAPAIGELAARRAVEGYADGSYGPEDAVRRQQFAKMIVTSLRLPVGEGDVCTFSDVEIGGPGTLYPDNFVAVAADRGITRGTAPGQFAPYRQITRAQVVTMVVRAVDARAAGRLAMPPAGYKGTWGDFDAAHQANAQVAEFNHLLDGLLLRRLDPLGPMSRAEVAQVLNNMIAMLQIMRPPIMLGTE